MPADLGPLGLWSFTLDQLPTPQARETAADIEAQGWGAIWIPEAVGRDPLVHAALLLDATERIVVATGIAGIYSRDAMAMNAGWQTLSEAFPERFLLGLGVSHAPMVEGMRGSEYRAPIATMRAYLERMDDGIFLAAPPSKPPERVLAALGPKMLELAREKTRGAHPYLVPPEHTAIARAALAIYIPGIPNYVNNLRRLGFTDDDLGATPSDRLVDAVVAWGDVDAIATRVRAHRDAGADHVALQVLPYDDPERAMRDSRTLGEALL